MWAKKGSDLSSHNLSCRLVASFLRLLQGIGANCNRFGPLLQVFALFDLLCQVKISVLDVFIRLHVWEGVPCFCKCGKVLETFHSHRSDDIYTDAPDEEWSKSFAEWVSKECRLNMSLVAPNAFLYLGNLVSHGHKKKEQYYCYLPDNT